MAEKSSSDLIMKFVKDDGTCIQGEAQTDLDFAESDMTTGFSKGYLIELQSFTLGVSVDGSDAESKDKAKAYSQQKKSLTAVHASNLAVIRSQNALLSSQGKPTLPEPADPSGSLSKPDSADSFAKWRAAGGGGSAGSYPADVNPVEITRSIDRASTDLLDACINRKMFKSATLIKRKAAGGVLADGRSVSGEIFLRFDFVGVLLTGVDWDEDDPVKEKIKFIARAITMSYRPQLPDGSLGGVVPGFYTMAPDLKIFTLKGSN